MKKRKLLLSALSGIFFCTSLTAGHLMPNLLISAKLTGAQEVPAVSTNALGVASFMLNESRDTICVNISVTGLSGPITGIHVHEGDPGVAGPVIIDLTPYVNGNMVTTVLTGADVSAANISKFLSGKFYVNAHTTANPNGEIRGQLNLETDWGFTCLMDGSQEVPAVSTSAYGVGAFNVSMDSSKINFIVVTQGLSGSITGAHLHWGAQGVAGTIAVDLTSFINGNVISGSTNGFTAAFIDSLMKMKIYFNVHTASNPNGEIRGQLMHSERYLYMDATLNGSQEVPAVITNAMSAATVRLNSTFDTLWYDIAATGLSGAITTAHFHNANPGVSGSPVIDITSSINGNRISGTVTGTALSQNIINQFLAGAMYVNLHTAANPNGEIRGQVYRLAREGYSFSMNGQQEVPPVTTAATGSGLVSVDRNNDNAHFMFTTNGLTATAAHFHEQIAGQSGAPVFDLLPYLSNNGAFGFWRSSDATAFTTAISGRFRKDSIYVNVHTATNPNGEIRGQVLRGFQCFNVTAGISDQTAKPFETKLYPNPARDKITVDLNSAKKEKLTITIIDALGREIMNTTYDLHSGINSISFEINGLDNGLYIVKLLKATGTQSIRFIK